MFSSFFQCWKTLRGAEEDAKNQGVEDKREEEGASIYVTKSKSAHFYFVGRVRR